VEDEAVPPHDDSDRVVAVGEAVGRDEEPFGAWEEPDGQEGEGVDKVAEVGQKIVVAFTMVSVEADRHEIGELHGEPPVEALRHGSHQIAGDEDVEDGGDEGDLLAGGDGHRFCPSLVDIVDGPLHAPAVFGQLLFTGGDSLAQLCDGLLGFGAL